MNSKNIIWIVNALLMVIIYILPRGNPSEHFLWSGIWAFILALINFVLALLFLIFSFFNILGYAKIQRSLGLGFFFASLFILLISFGTCTIAVNPPLH